MIGKKYGSKTVLCELPSTRNSKGVVRRWQVRCDCGREMSMTDRQLRKKTAHCQKCKPSNKFFGKPV